MKVIVTGHSRGLGAAIAAELLERGIPVLGLARQSNVALQKKFPTLLQQHDTDLADTVALVQWLEGPELTQFLTGSSTAALINNAGTVQPIGAPDVVSATSMTQAINLNVSAPLILTAAFLTVSTTSNDRRILHISSGAGRNAYPGWSTYCATKAALDHHARAVALDRISGLRICSMAPGVIDTAMQSEIRSTTLEHFPLRERFDNLKLDGHLQTPQHCAHHLVSYLLGDHYGDVPVATLADLH